MNNKPVFNNRQNQVYLISPWLYKIYLFIVKLFRLKVKEVWNIRSSAVVGIIFIKTSTGYLVIATKRSLTMPDKPGMWVVPCGYLDWDECGWDALRREVFEETSFFMDKYEKNLVFCNNKEPFYVKTEIDENRQNVVLNYCLVYDFSTNEKDIPFYIMSYADSEVAKVDFLTINEIDNKKKYDWAFNHDERIKNAFNFYLKHKDHECKDTEKNSVH